MKNTEIGDRTLQEDSWPPFQKGRNPNHVGEGVVRAHPITEKFTETPFLQYLEICPLESRGSHL